MRYLLDTCVISELAAKQPNDRVVQWIDSADPDAIYLSVITIGEIQKGIEKLPTSRRRRALQDWLNDELLVRFENRLVTLDVDVLLTWGRLIARLESAGTVLPAMDSLLAATALHGNLVLVTRNEADFVRTGVKLQNPWR